MPRQGTAWLDEAPLFPTPSLGVCWRMLRVVAPSQALSEGGAVLFEALVAGERRDCVAVRVSGGAVAAFVNICAHRRQPVVVDGRPFDEAGRLECRAHGAFYDPLSGVCVEGPCEGARLSVVPLREREGVLWVEDDDLVDDSVYGDEPGAAGTS